MAVSSTTTLAGIQDKLVADVTAIFRTQSVLFDAVDAKDVGDALVGQFHTQSVPAVVTAHTEGEATTATTITLTAKNATLEEFPIMASLSTLSDTVEGQKVVARTLGATLARTIDTAICEIGDGFTATQGDVSGQITLDAILAAKATLDTTGYVGEVICVLSPKAVKKVGADTLEITNPTRDSEAYMRTGRLGDIGGVQIYQSAWVTQDATHTSTDMNFMCFKDAIGLAYRNPMVELKQSFTHSTTTEDYTAISKFGTVEVTDGAGVVLYDYNA